MKKLWVMLALACIFGFAACQWGQQDTQKEEPVVEEEITEEETIDDDTYEMGEEPEEDPEE